MSDYPMLISNKLHSFRNFTLQTMRDYIDLIFHMYLLNYILSIFISDK